MWLELGQSKSNVAAEKGCQSIESFDNENLVLFNFPKYEVLSSHLFCVTVR